jgi:CemA family
MASDPSKPEPIKSGQMSKISLFDWFLTTPERAIDEAYLAAIAIKKLEDGFFEGKIISYQSNYSDSNNSYFRIQLDKSLSKIRRRLAEYKLSARLPFCLQPAIAPQQLLQHPTDQTIAQTINPILESAPAIIQKLAFIDFILERYRPTKKLALPSVPAAKQLLDLTELERSQNIGKVSNYSFFGKEAESEKEHEKKERIITPIEKSILPGSLFRTLSRIQNSFRDQNFRDYEQDVVTELRMSQKRVRVAIQFFATLLIVFLVAQQGSKYLFFSPLVDYINRNRQLEVSLAPRLEELETELVEKYRNLKVKVELESLVASLNLKAPELPNKKDDSNQTETTSTEVKFLSPVFDYAELGEQFKEEAIKLVQEINYKELEGIKNALADVLAGFAGYAAVIINRRQLFVIKDFMDETLYSLNDSAKALILIISTDIIVGFHSSEGWDALLTGIAYHYGQPENRFFTRTFIAIVPVFLDGIFKFWIFQYLRQRSPSTATIFEQMNR